MDPAAAAEATATTATTTATTATTATAAATAAPDTVAFTYSETHTQLYILTHIHKQQQHTLADRRGAPSHKNTLTHTS